MRWAFVARLSVFYFCRDLDAVMQEACHSAMDWAVQKIERPALTGKGNSLTAMARVKEDRDFLTIAQTSVTVKKIWSFGLSKHLPKCFKVVGFIESSEMLVIRYLTKIMKLGSKNSRYKLLDRVNDAKRTLINSEGCLSL